ncbi:MAG: hypothetical protein K2Y71_00870 [Xanthobacteraceae bacterium]|nr:hypothetical protein [Xanthobacteraceae bacterium]
MSPEIVDLLRSDKLRGYRIDIETDSTVFEDEAALKEQTVEVMTAIGSFMREALPVVQAVPELSPLAFEMLEMGVRQLKRGRALEDTIEQSKQAILQKVAQAKQQQQQQAQQPQAPPPDPKAMAEQARAATIQANPLPNPPPFTGEGWVGAAIGAQEMQVRQQELALKVQELELKQRELQTKLSAAQQQAMQQASRAEMLGAEAPGQAYTRQ